jgi:hypothetical protein
MIRIIWHPSAGAFEFHCLLTAKWNSEVTDRVESHNGVGWYTDIELTEWLQHVDVELEKKRIESERLLKYFRG